MRLKKPGMKKTISLYLMIALYLGAGVNHFIHKKSYLAIIPPYFPNHAMINILAGIAELILGAMLIFKQTRTAAAYGIIVLLVFFIPVHIYMIQKNICLSEIICWPWVAWVRLFPVQLLLIWWAWSNRK